jgi:hypothetical protein
MIAVICNTQERFERWCRENAQKAGHYNAVNGKAKHALPVKNWMDLDGCKPTQIVRLEYTGDWELESLPEVQQSPIIDAPAPSKIRGRGRPPKRSEMKG